MQLSKSKSVDAVDESLNEESLQEISGELLGQEIAEAKLDELEEVEEFHVYCTWIRWKKGDEIGAWLVARGL